MLPQSTEAPRVSRSYSKVAYLNGQTNCSSSSSYETTIDRQEISQGWFFVLSFEAKPVYALGLHDR